MLLASSRRTRAYWDICAARAPGTSVSGPAHLLARRLMVRGGSGYSRFLAPPEKVLRWIEAKLNLLGRLPHYISVDQKTYGRYGVLPMTSMERNPDAGQRLGP